MISLLLSLILTLSGDQDPREVGGGSTFAMMKQPAAGPFGCTVVMTRHNGLILIGNNEDRNNPQTVMTVVPPDDRYHGRVLFGYTDAPYQGGMNDQGLFVDGNAVAPTGWKSDPEKPVYSWNVIMTVLATCSTCEDVKSFFNEYNIPALERARFPVADRSGASMVVEYGGGKVQFVESDSWYQIATNFIMSNVQGGDISCWRYRAADKLLAEAETLDVPLLREVLEATHQEGRSLTVYSNIYDLQSGSIHLYQLRNFNEVVVLNLFEVLKGGERQIELATLFEEEPSVPQVPE